MNTDITYRWMESCEVGRVAEIDRKEIIRKGYVYRDGELQKIDVVWDIPGFLVDGDGEHSIAAQVEFCRNHIDRCGCMYGAFDGERLVGVGVIQHEVRPNLTQLAYLQVSDGYRRRGIGSRITQELIYEAASYGAVKLYVSATPSNSAVGFYLSRGFSPVDTPIPELYELEPEDIHMIRVLNSSEHP